jgi:HSP20 family molecular chaperone IbpA
MNSKWTIGLGVLLGILIGGGITYFFLNYDLVKKNDPDDQKLSPVTSADLQKRKGLHQFFDQTFDDDFFNQSFSPFKQMEKMRESMNKLFQMEPGSGDMFDPWFDGRFGGSVFDIEQKEDDQFIIYEIKLKGLSQSDLNVDISDGMLTISGKLTRGSEEKNAKSVFSQSFNRSFPVPHGVDADKAEFDSTDESVIVKFPKV